MSSSREDNILITFFSRKRLGFLVASPSFPQEIFKVKVKLFSERKIGNSYSSLHPCL